MSATRRRRVGLAVVGLGLGVVAVIRPVPSHAATAQAVVAPGGLLAHGYVPDARFGGDTRWISVILVVPAGPVASSPAVGGVDLARPWAVVSVTSVDTGQRVCGRVQNTAAFDPGRLTQAGGGGEAWRGTRLDIGCDDGSGYLFYRVEWDAGAQWLVRNPLPLEYSGGHLTRWSAPPYRGLIEAVPTSVQQTRLTVCGYRSAASVPGPGDCFGGGSAYGTVIPTSERITAEAAEAAL